MEILKFRAFSSRQRQGFVLLKRGPLPELILEDILFQLFEPLFSQIRCPQIYFFSSTDQILKTQELSRAKDYIYVYFLERIQKYVHENKIQKKIKIGSLEKLSLGLSFNGTDLYIFSEWQYLMYGKPVFRQGILRKINELQLKQKRKQIKYNEYFEEMTQLKDNRQMLELKDRLQVKVKTQKEKVQDLQILKARCLKVKATLTSILANTGISIKSISDL